MDSMNEKRISVNPVKSRAEYMALVTEMMTCSENLQVEEFSSPEYFYTVRNMIAAEAQVYATLALAAPDSPSVNAPVSPGLLHAADAALRYFETDAEGIHPEKVVSNLRAAIAASMKAPTPVSDPCVDELAQHLAQQTFINGTLMQEKSALLDVLTRVYLNRKQMDDELEIALCETLVKAGRL